MKFLRIATILAMSLMSLSHLLRRIEKKKRLKEMFDQDYDDKGEERTMYDEMKEQMNQQAQVCQKLPALTKRLFIVMLCSVHTKTPKT